MARYAAKRTAWAALVIWVTITLTFIATKASSIDPVRARAGTRVTNDVVEQIRHRFGLDQSLPAQYWDYLRGLVRADFGVSYTSNTDVLPSILDRLPATAELALAAMVVQLVLGISLGLLAALRHRTAVDRAVLAFSLVGIVTPAFVLGFLLLYLLAFQAGWFPLGGNASPASIVLPACTLGIAGAAWYARMVRSSVLNAMGEDYVRMARAKGLPERVVFLRHVMRNSISPIIAMSAADMGVFLGGLLVIERVFDWPGLGQLAWTAVQANDIPLVMGTVLFAAIFVVLLNLLADLVVAAIDPRVDYV